MHFESLESLINAQIMALFNNMQFNLNHHHTLSPAVTTIILLIVSNIFMTLAWYGHLKLQTAGISSNWPLYIVILFSWGIALCEYCFMIPANRIGFDGNGGPYSLMQLKVMQEVITLVVFVIFSLIAFDTFKLRWNHILAFFMLIGAVWLVFLK